MIMAYLIHRQGSVVSRKELAAVLFEDGIYDANRQSHMSKLCADVRQTLTDIGIEDLIQETSDGMAVVREALDCDLYDALAGSREVMQKYSGEYMAQYSFGEEMTAHLNDMKDR